MSITLKPAKPEDVPEIAKMEMAAFSPSEHTQILYPGGTTENSLKQRAERIYNEWRDDPSMRFIKAVDSKTGELLGSARWHLYLKERSTSEWDVNDEPEDWGEGANNAACKAFFGALHEKRRRIMAGNPHILLSVLATYPEKQRRGAGTALVKWGCDQADAERLPVYLESTPVALPVYKKLGFKEVDLVVLEFKPYTGGEGSIKFANMIRQTRCNFY